VATIVLPTSVLAPKIKLQRWCGDKEQAVFRKVDDDDVVVVVVVVDVAVLLLLRYDDDDEKNETD
jgi:hypothetical protein